MKEGLRAWRWASKEAEVGNGGKAHEKHMYRGRSIRMSGEGE